MPIVHPHEQIPEVDARQKSVDRPAGGSASPDRTDPRSLVSMQTWPLTGRAEELEVITDALWSDRPYGGVVIAGTAGVGKTRLARKVMDSAAQQCWEVRWVAGTSAVQSVPLGAFAQWADQPEGSPLQLVARVIAAVTESPSGAPVLVVVDDAGLLDDLSAFVLQQLVFRRAATVVATIRTGAPAPDAVTALWKDGHLRRLDLQPLSREQSDALLQSVLGGPVNPVCAEQLWHLTRGNVLFLRQLITQEMQAGRLVRHDHEWRLVGTMTVSQSLVDLVDLRIGAVPEPVLEVIDLVAVAEPLELAYLAAVADGAAIEDAERRGLITVSHNTPNRVARLGHPLYGEVRLGHAGKVRMQRLRGRIARTISAVDATVGAPDPVRLALLWQESDLSPDHDLFTRAAQAAFRRLDVDLARRLAEAAVAAGGGQDTELLWATTLTLLSRGAEAEALLKSLTARTLPEPTWSTAVNQRAVNLLWPLGQPEQSRAVVDNALAGASGPAADRLSAFRAVQLAVEARPDEALTICESVDPAGLTALPALTLAWAHTIALGDLGCPLQADAIADKAAALAEESVEAAACYQMVILGVYHAQALILGGCLAQALTVANHIHRQHADVPGAAHSFAAGINGMAALGCGDLATATERLRCAVAEFADRTDGGAYVFGIYYAQALAQAGDIDAALHALAQMQGTRHPAHVYCEPDRLVAAAWVAAARGRLPQARSLAMQGAEYARTHGQHAREVMSLQAAIQFGDCHHAARLSELADLVDGPRAGLVARWAAALGRQDGGEALLAVSNDLEELGDRVAAADAAAQAWQTFRRHSRRGQALSASGRAQRLITECAATTPATQAATMTLPLTDRERGTAILVAQGLSNKEIADLLTVSVRTVEGHIYHGCANAGVKTRAELAELVAQFIPLSRSRHNADGRPASAMPKAQSGAQTHA